VELIGYKVCDAASVIYNNSDSVALEWNSDPVTDMLADSIIALLYQSTKVPGINQLIDIADCLTRQLQSCNRISNTIQFYEQGT
jgi:hypothetical protein